MLSPIDENRQFSSGGLQQSVGYNLPTYPVLINILPPAGSFVIATRYESEFRGLQARQDYHVINLWEVETEVVFQQPLPSLIPFVPVLRGGGEESTVRRALQVLRTDEQLSKLEPLLAFFASFVLSIPLANPPFIPHSTTR